MLQHRRPPSWVVGEDAVDEKKGRGTGDAGRVDKNEDVAGDAIGVGAESFAERCDSTAAQKRDAKLLRVCHLSHLVGKFRKLRRLPLDTFSLSNGHIGRANLNPIKCQVANSLLAPKPLWVFLAGDMCFGEFKTDFNHACISNDLSRQANFVDPPSRFNPHFANELFIDENPQSVAPNCRTVPTQNECRILGRARLLPSQSFHIFERAQFPPNPSRRWQQNHGCVSDSRNPTNRRLTSCTKSAFWQLAPIFTTAETLNQNCFVSSNADVNEKIERTGRGAWDGGRVGTTLTCFTCPLPRIPCPALRGYEGSSAKLKPRTQNFTNSLAFGVEAETDTTCRRNDDFVALQVLQRRFALKHDVKRRVDRAQTLHSIVEVFCLAPTVLKNPVVHEQTHICVPCPLFRVPITQLPNRAVEQVGLAKTLAAFKTWLKV